MKMTENFKNFIAANIEEMHIFEVCKIYKEIFQGILEIVGVGIDNPEELATHKKAKREIGVCEELENGMVLFWDHKNGCPFNSSSYLDDEHLYLFCCHEKFPSLDINPNLGDKVYVTEGYLYKEVVSSYSLTANGSPFTSINWQKTTYKVKVADLPKVNEEVYKEHGYRVRADLGLVQIPEWEEVSTQCLGHEY